ncbi:MAG: glycosyltransferase involved in cell wall biosynthesis [Gammaproteobacteria bacterium]|jgi:glycosyltransferase involved in cell wall biosynthesis
MILNSKPLVTFTLFAYNQEKYIREAIEGAFAQTYEPLEIILSDDCSTDTTFEIMQEMAAEYPGSHNVKLNRSSGNLGLVGHINSVMLLAHGELIVVAAGDDVSLAQRTSIIVERWLASDKVSGSLYSHYRTIDDTGVRTPPKQRSKAHKVYLADRDIEVLNHFSGISGCAHAWTKDLFEIFGPLDKRIDHEDVIIPLRALLVGAITFIPLDLVDYRLTQGSITRKTFVNSHERFQKMEKYWSGRVAIFDQFQRDAKAAKNKGLVDEGSLDWLCNKAKVAKNYAVQQQTLYDSGRFTRLLCAINPFCLLSFRDRLKWLIIVFYPRIYGSSFARFLK